MAFRGKYSTSDNSYYYCYLIRDTDETKDKQVVFDNLVDVTEPICQAIDSAKADMTIFDSSGIEAFVTENNPKYANRIIKQLKAYAKAQGFDKSYDPYKAAYGSMPSHASANPEIKQLYINGHFCYVFKFGIVTNGLGIIRHISFYNKNFIDRKSTRLNSSHRLESRMPSSA